MLDVGGLVDGLVDEFKLFLSDFDNDYLQSLRDDSRALRRILPAGVSCGEAMLLIDSLLTPPH